MNKKVLHICNGLQVSKFYIELFDCIKNQQYDQTVIAPVFNIENNDMFKRDNICVKYFKRERSFFLRFLLIRKVNKIYDYILRNTNVFEFDIVHAHSLFSDGAVAYELYKKFNIPYLVAVRNTDVNVFFKYFKWHNKLGFDILENAHKIIFISNSYKNNVLDNIVPFSLKSKLLNKSIVIPNGINNKWLLNRKYKEGIDGSVNLCYTGVFRRNKNIHSTIKAVKKLRKQGYDITLTIIGKTINDESMYVKLIESLYFKLKYIDVYEKMTFDQLLNKYKFMNAFIMPSYTETFGLVYVEAISQGLPVIYSKNQGFDGFYKEGYVGYSVNPNDVNSIVDAILKIVTNYEYLSSNIRKESLDIFNWNNIAEKYIELYN